MRQEAHCLQACKVANIQFLFQRRKATHTNSHKILFQKKTSSDPPQGIKRNVESFIPKTYVHTKRELLDHISQRARNKPFQPFELEYKKFPARKARSASAHHLIKRQSNFNLGVQSQLHTFFRNPTISKSLCTYHSESRESRRNPPKTAYAPRKRGSSSLY